MVNIILRIILCKYLRAWTLRAQRCTGNRCTYVRAYVHNPSAPFGLRPAVYLRAPPGCPPAPRYVDNGRYPAHIFRRTSGLQTTLFEERRFCSRPLGEWQLFRGCLEERLGRCVFRATCSYVLKPFMVKLFWVELVWLVSCWTRL